MLEITETDLKDKLMEFYKYTVVYFVCVTTCKYSVYNLEKVLYLNNIKQKKV